jgi:hypothetical protein
MCDEKTIKKLLQYGYIAGRIEKSETVVGEKIHKQLLPFTTLKMKQRFRPADGIPPQN